MTSVIRLKMHSAGSGAYSLKVYQPNQAIVMASNPHVSTGEAKIPSIIIKTCRIRLPAVC